jgi:hypothetical protein
MFSLLAYLELFHKLFVGVLDWQPTKGSTRGRCLWSRDRELEGETRRTQFTQVRIARCVISYVL